MTLWRRLPLDHDGLVGAAAGNDVLWRSTGWLLGQRHTERDGRVGVNSSIRVTF